MDNNSLLPASFGEASQIALDDDDLVQAGATCLASPLADFCAPRIPDYPEHLWREQWPAASALSPIR
jgi:hypothetical protein